MAFHEILGAFVGNPFVYFLLVFGFSILVAIILPIPIELALVVALAQPGIALFLAALLAVALGKAVGAWLVFVLGIMVEHAMHRWAQRASWIAKVLGALEKFVRWSGSVGLFVLLSIPLMSDTAVLYFYALFNEEGKTIDQRHFILTNFLAGVSRVSLFFILAFTIFPWLLPTP